MLQMHHKLKRSSAQSAASVTLGPLHAWVGFCAAVLKLYQIKTQCEAKLSLNTQSRAKGDVLWSVPTTPRSSSAFLPPAIPCTLDSSPNPQPGPTPAPPQLLSEDIEKEKGPGLMCN